MSGFYLGFFVLEVDPKKFLEPRSGEKRFFRPCRGPGACWPKNFEKIVFRIG